MVLLVSASQRDTSIISEVHPVTKRLMPGGTHTKDTGLSPTKSLFIPNKVMISIFIVHVMARLHADGHGRYDKEEDDAISFGFSF